MSLSLGIVPPAVEEPQLLAGRHLVQFYESDTFLCSIVTKFLVEGFTRGEPCLVVAEPSHRIRVLQSLRARNVDVDRMQAAGRLVMLDARGTLDRFVHAGRIDPIAFNAIVGGTVDEMMRRTGVTHIRAFGEMVNLLWREGRRDLAIELEERWNELGRTRDFTLLCAYEIDSFPHQHGKNNCALHDQMMATEPEIRLQEFLDEAPVAIHTVDRHGIIRWANRAELDFVGYAATEYIGMPVMQFHVDPTVAEDIIARVARGETVRDREASIRTKGGEIRRVMITSNGEFDKDGGFNATRCFTRDVTDKETLVDELQRTVRLNEMFAGVLGHDLRNPLNTITIAGQVVLESIEDDDRTSRHLRRLLDSAGRMQRMIDQLLDFSGVRANSGIRLERRMMDIATTARDAVDELRIAHPGRRIELETRGELSGAWDANRFAQVFSNLVGNAVQHGGQDAAVVVLMDGTSADEVRISIANRGTIPADILPVVFEPFRGSHHRVAKTHGLGLGLFITEQIIRAHGGTIEAHSRDDTTTFAIVLPRASGVPIASFDTPASRATTTPPPIDQEPVQFGDHQRFQLLVEGVKEYAIFMLDPKGHVATWNPGASRIKGYQASEIIGKHFSIFYPADDVAGGKCEEELLIAKREGRFEEEGWRIRKDGSTFWASVVITALYESDKLVGFAKITRDLTERRRIEEDRVRLAETRAALRGRDEFLAIASHELKTPIANLRLQLDGLLESVSAATTQHRLERANRAVERLDELVETILDVSRIATGRYQLRFEEVSVGDLVRAAVDRAHPAAASAGCEIVVSIDAKAVVLADRGRLVQAVDNLVSNAIKYAAGSPIEASVRCEGDEVVIAVRDHGPGIAPGGEARLFQRFEREPTSRNYSGLGLGLYLVGEIAKMHRGSAVAANANGGGARFEVRLPRLHPTDP